MLEPGTLLGPYRIESLLGSGGMGEVYRGRDDRLQRGVAIKVLPSSIDAQDDALERFSREARAVSALNHPNIVTIYDVGDGEVDGVPVRYIAMELLEGETLGRKIGTPELSPLVTVRLLLQIAEGLTKAHASGILHRDLKPDNVVVTRDGYAKILDFGLAKLIRPDLEGFASSADTLQQISASRGGGIQGTLAYMSPEQIRAEPLDGRSDIFSFGCIAYETISGRSPFGRASALDVIDSILHAEPPPLTSLAENTPAELQRIARRCLRKDREERYQSMRDVVIDLRELAEEMAQPAARPASRLTQLTFAKGIEAFPAWSPDGSRIAFARDLGKARRIYVKRLDSGEETPVTRATADEIQPAWSPDGSTLLFMRSQSDARIEPDDVFGRIDNTDVWSVDLQSGEERRVLRKAANATWSPDGTSIAFDADWSGPTRIWVAESRGHNARQVTTDSSEAMWHMRPRWSPDGKKIVFQNAERTKFDIRVVDLQSGELHWVTNDAVQDVEPVWSPSGRYIVFSSYRSGGVNLWRVPVDEQGNPIGPLDQVTTGGGQDIQAEISRDGSRVVFSILRQNANVWRLPVDPTTGFATGPPEEVTATTREDSRGSWSADGEWIAFNSDRSGAMNIWVRSMSTGAERQLTRGPGGDFQPSWSRDGKRITFFSGRGGSVDIWTVEVATGELHRLTSGPSVDVNPFFSPDGSNISFHSDADGRLELWIMRSDGSEVRQLTRCGVGGHFHQWTRTGDGILFRCPNAAPITLFKVAPGGEEPKAIAALPATYHMTFSPDESRMMDVLNHKTLCVSRLDTGETQTVFEFDDPDSRIDYPVWSPDGRWVLFDHFRPHGGDIWMMENVDI